MANKELTAFEKWVMESKGTEQPFSGEYCNMDAKGIYLCKRCGAALYRSEEKFASHCGWPSFEGEISGAVKHIPDADGRRTEIVCQSCQGHLGHVFEGEGYTPKNVRHCVNSVSLEFKPASDLARARAVFASGCFWGTEYHFARAPGVLETHVGYVGGHIDTPTYKEVCAGATGHYEAVEVIFDSTRTNFETLAKLFFETHDFGQEGGQGPDIGPQYKSAIFCQSLEEVETSQNLIRLLKEKGMPVATEIKGDARFWRAEESHQKYYFKNAKTPYCHVFRKVF